MCKNQYGCCQWYAGKSLKKSSPGVTGRGCPWFVVFADFCGVNTPTMANLKLSMWTHWMWSWEWCLQLASIQMRRLQRAAVVGLVSGPKVKKTGACSTPCCIPSHVVSLFPGAPETIVLFISLWISCPLGLPWWLSSCPDLHIPLVKRRTSKTTPLGIFALQ